MMSKKAKLDLPPEVITLEPGATQPNVESSHALNKAFVVREEEGEASSSNSTSVFLSGDRLVCAFGSKCYRRNPVHFQEFAHPLCK
jgi:hypothetical protein